MDNIRQAIERAKGGQRSASPALEPPRPAAREIFGDALGRGKRVQDTDLDPLHLEAQRIVGHNGNDIRSRSFDMLRTEILQSMDAKGWKTLAVTSPTPSCGKTFTSVNLALSMSRRIERQVLLADLDLRKPHVADCMGIKCVDGGVSAVVEGRLELHDAIVSAKIGSSQLEVLPTKPASNSSDVASSAGMEALLQKLAGRSQSGIVILDLPPILTGHDVLSILPHVDCLLFVTAVGKTKKSEIKECSKYLEGTNIVRFVLNKAAESAIPYIYY